MSVLGVVEGEGPGKLLGYLIDSKDDGGSVSCSNYIDDEE